MKVLRFIDCMLLWNYIFAAGQALRGRQIDTSRGKNAKAQAMMHLGSGVLPAVEKGPTTNHHLCTIAQSSCVVVLVEIVEMESSTPLPLPDTQRSPIWQHTAALRAMFQLDGFLLLP